MAVESSAWTILYLSYFFLDVKRSAAKRTNTYMNPEHTLYWTLNCAMYNHVEIKLFVDEINSFVGLQYIH